MIKNNMQNNMQNKQRVIENKLLSDISPTDYWSTSAQDIQLKEKKYTISDLEFIIENLSVRLTSILYTQKLTSEFCIKYILRDDEYYLFIRL